jgi:hypothetical protein
MNGLFGDEVLWFAKNVNKPSVQFESNAGPQAGAFVMGAGQAGQKLGYINPGALQAFSPINITFIDPNGTEEGNNRVVDRLMQYLETNAKTNDYYGLANASNKVLRLLPLLQEPQLLSPELLEEIQILRLLRDGHCTKHTF